VASVASFAMDHNRSDLDHLFAREDRLMTFIRSRTCMLAFSTLLATFVFSGSSPAQGAAVQEDATAPG